MAVQLPKFLKEPGFDPHKKGPETICEHEGALFLRNEKAIAAPLKKIRAVLEDSLEEVDLKPYDVKELRLILGNVKILNAKIIQHNLRLNDCWWTRVLSYYFGVGVIQQISTSRLADTVERARTARYDELVEKSPLTILSVEHQEGPSKRRYEHKLRKLLLVLSQPNAPRKEEQLYFEIKQGHGARLGTMQCNSNILSITPKDGVLVNGEAYPKPPEGATGRNLSGKHFAVLKEGQENVIALELSQIKITYKRKPLPVTIGNPIS